TGCSDLVPRVRCDPGAHRRIRAVSRRAAGDYRILLALTDSEAAVAIRVDAEGAEIERFELASHEVVDWVRNLEEAEHPRWVIRSAREIYPRFLTSRVQLTRTHDLMLCHAILRDTDIVARPLAPSVIWIPGEPEFGEP